MNAGRILIVFYLVTTLGCVVLHDTSSVWKDDKSSIDCEGPGSVDSVFYRINHNLYECDSGSRTSIGFFPGMWDPPPATKRGNMVIGSPDKWEEFVAWSLVENIFGLFIPTLASMIYGPFPVSEKSNSITRGGLCGVHRWNEASSEKLQKGDGSECVIIKEHPDKSDFIGNSIIGSDGMVLFVRYPGFDRLFAEVEKHGCVDVLHFSGDSIRRFWMSALDEHALKFEDRVSANEPCSIERKKFLSECARLKNRIRKLRIDYGEDVNEFHLHEMENVIAIKEKKIGWDWPWTKTIANDLTTEGQECERKRIARRVEEERRLAVKRKWIENMLAHIERAREKKNEELADILTRCLREGFDVKNKTWWEAHGPAILTGLEIGTALCVADNAWENSRKNFGEETSTLDKLKEAKGAFDKFQKTRAMASNVSNLGGYKDHLNESTTGFRNGDLAADAALCSGAFDLYGELRKRGYCGKYDDYKAFEFLVERFDCSEEQISWYMNNCMRMNVNCSNSDNKTILMLAVENNRFATAKWLLENGANPNVRSKDTYFGFRKGKTAREIAVDKGLKTIVKLIDSMAH